MGRKDRERFLRRKQENADYAGFRGLNSVPVKTVAETETVVCSVCNRRRNVAIDTIPEDRSAFVCLRCQEEQQEVEAPAANA